MYISTMLLREKDAFNCIHISVYTTTIKSAHVRTCRVLHPTIESIMYRRMCRCTFSLYTMSINVGNVDMYDLHRDQETTVAVRFVRVPCCLKLMLKFVKMFWAESEEQHCIISKERTCYTLV